MVCYNFDNNALKIYKSHGVVTEREKNTNNN